MNRSKNKTFSFFLVLSGVNERTPHLEDKLFDAGCDDALISYKNGIVCMDFDRESSSLESAIQSAITDIKSASVGAQVDHVEGEYVTLSDIAEKTKLTKQAISLFVKGKRGSGGFPIPFCGVNSASPVWRWVDVASWMVEHQKSNNAQLLEEAKLINEINRQLSKQRWHHISQK